MYEAQGPEQVDPLQLRDGILKDVDFSGEFSKEDFTYDSSLHGLTVPGDSPETFRLAFFRAVNKNATDVANRPPESANNANAQFGPGLYGGNSVEAVAHFAWPGDRTVKLFLSPEIERGRVSDVTYPPSSTTQEALDLAKLKLGTFNPRLGAKNQANLAKQYGDSDLVVMSQPLDVKISQRLQAGPHQKPISPFWYLWRPNNNEGFEPVGEATRFPQQRKIAKIAVNALMGSPKS